MDSNDAHPPTPSGRRSGLSRSQTCSERGGASAERSTGPSVITWGIGVRKGILDSLDERAHSHCCAHLFRLRSFRRP